MQTFHRNLFRMMHHGQPFFFLFLRQIDRQRERKEIRNRRTNLKEIHQVRQEKKRTKNETKKDKNDSFKLEYMCQY